MIGFGFHEVMEGAVLRTGERFDRPFHFEVEVSSPRLLARVAMCEAHGVLHLAGLAKSARVSGRLEVSPLVERRIRYVLDFDGDDGGRYRFDGSKSIAPFAFPRRLLKSWTTLPGTIMSPRGDVWAKANLRFDLARIGALASSLRIFSSKNEVAHA